MSQSETAENDRKVNEYWAKTRRFSIYDIGSIDLKNEDNQLPYESTAALSTNQPPTKRFSIFDLSK